MSEDRLAEDRGMGSGVVKRVGGRLCLDFVNSVRARLPGGTDSAGREWMDRIADERITSYAALVRWGAAAGAISDGDASALLRTGTEQPEAAQTVHARALALREAIYRIFKAALERWPIPSGDLAVLNDEVWIARGHEKIVAAVHPRWEWTNSTEDLDHVLWPIAVDAAALLTSPELGRVGQCPGTECGWLFLDRSRSGRRRWCDMADCGNLAKVRRHRERGRGSRASS
ncbi:MAG TPA: CGNR zinc finger domain-containing protein [Longimicrobiaceae bacterium]